MERIYFDPIIDNFKMEMLNNRKRAVAFCADYLPELIKKLTEIGVKNAKVLTDKAVFCIRNEKVVILEDEKEIYENYEDYKVWVLCKF